MALAAEVKRDVVAKYRRHKSDVGSSEVQVALLSQRILQLQEHFKANAKDFHSRRGLLTLVAKRRRLLNYLKNTEPERYKALIASLGIRR
jgi:small subunit ribosomal protein S15